MYLLACKWIFPPITVIQIQALVEGHSLHRDYVSWSKIPDNIKLAAIASEDQLFAKHDGFDWKALDKSLHSDKRKVKGTAASTISQQTAKNVFLWQGHGNSKYVRKGLEFVYTEGIELIWGKKRILEVYLNVIEMGPGIFGVEAAAQKYFGKPASKLSRSESAMIVAALPNPKKFTVKPMSGRVGWRYPQIVRQMRNLEGDKDIKKLMKD